jgi:prepilin-type processing-associated H-X9-DG protein
VHNNWYRFLTDGLLNAAAANGSIPAVPAYQIGTRYISNPNMLYCPAQVPSSTQATYNPDNRNFWDPTDTRGGYTWYTYTKQVDLCYGFNTASPADGTGYRSGSALQQQFVAYSLGYRTDALKSWATQQYASTGSWPTNGRLEFVNLLKADLPYGKSGARANPANGIFLMDSARFYANDLQQSPAVELINPNDTNSTNRFPNTGNATRIILRHGNGANILFYDGHAEWNDVSVLIERGITEYAGTDYKEHFRSNAGVWLVGP